LLGLERFPENPIITPRHGKNWEINGTFNPGTVDAHGAIHILYRAVDAKWISRLAYARSEDGRTISFRSSEPILEPSADWEELGCEDPRITAFDDRFYLTYTAFSRRGPRIALASTSDFSTFEKLGVVGPDRSDKDCVLFPERIGGRVAMLHRLASRVQVAYFGEIEDMTNSQGFWRKYEGDFHEYEVMRPKFTWESKKIGIGPPPIRTERGWLVIYHGVSADDVYSAGAALLDLEEPTKVLARTSQPILQPQMAFERQGFVPNVVFPEGAVVRDGKLLVYYGGADKVCCAAKAPFDEFLYELEKQR